MTNELTQPLRGIIPPLLTPLLPEGGIDTSALEVLLEHVISGGVHGIFLLGTTGEGPSLPYDERRELVRQACRIVDQRVPLLVGITDTVLDQSVKFARFACDEGCEATVAAPPYYFPVQQQELLAYYRRLAAELPLPLVLYNMPAVAGNTIGWEVLEALADLENVVGLKDSSGDLAYFEQAVKIHQQRPDFPVLVGPEHLLPQTMALGGSGGVTGGANLYPTLFVAVYEAAVSGDQASLQALEAKAQILRRIYDVGPRSISTIIARTKAAASLLGLCSNAVLPPLLAADTNETAAIELILDELNLLARRDTPDPLKPLHA